MRRRIWIVGGSTGIGLELVKLWLSAGEAVIASARSASRSDELMQLKSIYPDSLALLDLDVRSDDNTASVAEAAWKIYSGLDLWFYNAGAYNVMKAAEWNIGAFEQMNQVNYMGAVRLMNALYPYFLKEGSGRWVWNSSLSSYFGLPFGGGYSAPKAALVNLAESLQPELKQSGIELQIINHGFVKTRLTAKNRFDMPQLMEPSYAAAKIIKGLNEPYRFEIRFPYRLSLFLRMLKLLPYKIALALTAKTLP